MTRRYPVGLWLNLVCLDAPLVAIAWQWLFATTFHVALPVAGREALFFTAWLIYLTDRYSDSMALDGTTPRTTRQTFCAEHRLVWLVVIGAVALFDFWIVLWRLDHITRFHGLVLGAIASAYLIINYSCSRIWKSVPVKEITVGILFAAGTLLVFAEHVASAGLTMFVAALLFAALCSLNCISIAAWERDLDQAQGKCSIATRWAHAGVFALIAPALLAGASGVLVFFDCELAALAGSIGASALLLAGLHLVPIARDKRSAFADLVLLTPLVVLVLRHVP